MGNRSPTMRLHVPRVCAVFLNLAGTIVLLSSSPHLLAADDYDVVIRHGTVYDGSGRAPQKADVGIRGDRIAALGDLANATAKTVIDAKGLAVAPGFINMLSWSTES